MRILIADDSKTTLAVTAIALEEMGHEINAVLSGEEAVQSFKTKRPDLIILDVMMEGMDGFECARQIRAIASDDWIPIIFLSATVDDESISKGIDAGGDDYLTKPFSKITLAAKIKAMQRIADMRNKLFETTQELFLQSSTDSLTGIYNRFQFDKVINEITAFADRRHHLLALLFIDIDHFKNINDSFGHKIGDLLLKEIAKRLKCCLRTNDFLARIGGDEFAIILSELNNIEASGQVAEQILNEIGKPYELDSHVLLVGASIGIASYIPGTMSAANLLQNADISMYHAKSLGRNNYQYYSEELYNKYKKQISVEHGLKYALERNEFYLRYQPIFNLLTKKLIGIEVLLRWDHPVLGSIPPLVFIPIAEEIGIMPAIGNWIIHAGCNQYQKSNLSKNQNIKLAINFSSKQLLQRNFIDSISEALNESQLPPEIFEIELTETTIMGEGNVILKDILHQLNGMGITISIDDFGTGYSSLIRLKHLPITTLKIEKNFIQDILTNPNSRIIVSCIIALAKNLNLNITAEGIETKDQFDLLIELGCTQGQGSYLSQPLDEESLENLLVNIDNQRDRSTFDSER